MLKKEGISSRPPHALWNNEQRIRHPRGHYDNTANWADTQKGSLEEKRQYLQMMWPLNPYNKQGCTICEQDDIFADAKHYAMGHCKRATKHMAMDFEQRIAAWIMCHSCPGTWIHNEVVENEHIITTHTQPEGRSTSKQNSFMPQKVILHKPEQQTAKEIEKETDMQKNTHITPTQQNNTHRTSSKENAQSIDDIDIFYDGCRGRN